MVFTSLVFIIFLVIVFLLYWYVFNKNVRLQNFFVLTSSFVFYGWWDWRFLSLMLFSATVDYFSGIAIHNSGNTIRRKLFLFMSIGANLGLLGFFKYYNFFINSFVDFLQVFGLYASKSTLYIVLPVGISFYTFQALSYTIDIYRKQLTPTKDYISYLAFISFFPQLVAGPIERAGNLLPQFLKTRSFDLEKAKDGIRQALWGFFKKIVIADTCGRIVDQIFENYQFENSLTLIMGVMLFTFQIYADFSAYSDIAIGTARLFGFNLMRNFAYPNFSRDPGEYWRRWHISLSTWFRDYLFIPLGGSKTNKFKWIRNIIIVFTISGLWHGANWTFLAWGFLNGLYYIPLIIFDNVTKYKNVVAHNRILPSTKEFFQISVTFFLITLTRVFFRSPDIKSAFGYFKGMVSNNVFTLPDIKYAGVILLVLIFVIIEWINREKVHPLEGKFVTYPVFRRWAVYYGIVALIFVFYREVESFIYFQF